jgi:alkylhydroperoxidase family enzyme
VGSDLGLTEEQLSALAADGDHPDFTEAERVALTYADAITLSDRDVSDELFTALRNHFDDDTIVELTETIAWENASSKFNRALRIPSQGLWRRGDPAGIPTAEADGGPGAGQAKSAAE